MYALPSSKHKGTSLLLLATLLLVLLHHLRPTPTSSPDPATLHKAPQHHRASILSTAITSWTSGPPPLNLIVSAAACTPRDATDALFRHPSLNHSGVVDVGANKGYPVTRLALSAGAQWVVAVEPDDRNYIPLTRSHKHSRTLFKPVRGAVSDKVGVVEMAFHNARDDFTCFNCLNTSSDEVTVRKVDVHTVDGLVKEFDGDVALLKTDTQGHEAAVLSGAQGLLASGRLNAVLMEFDPKLLGRWENAERAVSLTTKAGLRCLSLVFAGLNGDSFPFFGKEVSIGTLPEFWEYVKAQDKYTDLFCLRR